MGIKRFDGIEDLNGHAIEFRLWLAASYRRPNHGMLLIPAHIVGRRTIADQWSMYVVPVGQKFIVSGTRFAFEIRHQSDHVVVHSEMMSAALVVPR